MSRFLKYLLAAVITFPFLFLLIGSVGQQWRFPALFPSEWTLDNWRLMIGGRSDLGESLLQSLVISMSLAFATTGLSFATARQISRHRYRNVLLRAAYLPYVFAPVILAATLQYYFIRFGLAGETGGVMLAQLFIIYPFGVIFFTGFWNERMHAMEQLTATLGGNRRQTFRRVLLPAAKEALLICFFQTFLISWFEFGLTTLIGVGKVQTLTVKVFQYIGEANIFYAALASTLLFIPPMVLLWVNKRFVFRNR